MDLFKASKTLLSDAVMERTFMTSALLGLGSIVVPFLAPVALTGMVASQSVFWGKRLAQQDDNK
jgi:hypothetical protein